MQKYTKVVTGTVTLAVIGLVAGCGATGGGTTNGTASNTVTNVAEKTTSTNNTVISQPSNNTPLSTNTSSFSQRSNNPPTIRTMPKYLYWTGLTSGKPTVQTDYGTVGFSQLGITKNDISVFLTSSGVKQTLYTFKTGNFKEVGEWQTEGQYLALKFGMPPSANPTTGDYGYQVVVIDLKTKQVVLTTGSAIQSTDYLDVPYFVGTTFETATNGTPEFFITIINLSAQTKITYQLPNSALGNVVESRGVIYYTVVNGKKQQIVSMVLPKTGWQSIKNNKWNPIQLPSNR